MASEAKTVLNALHSLRSIHGDFSDKPVSDEDMQTIIEAAIQAANSSARQCYSIITISGMERVKELCFYPAPRALIFLSDYTRLQDEARRRGYGTRPYSLADLLTSTMDASLAGQNAIIAARALGIDSLLTNSLLGRVDKDVLLDALNIPEQGCMPLFAVLLGYPGTEPAHQQKRYLGPGLLHNGQYHRMSESELRSMSSLYNEPGMGLAFSRWREQGYANYFEWYFTAWDTHPGTKNYKERGPGSAIELAHRAGYI